MMEDFSESLTPPVSPFAADGVCELPPAQPPCFCCCQSRLEPSSGLSAEGYVCAGALKRLLLRLDPAPSESEADTVELFGFQWVTETALVESTQLLFGLFRQRMYRLESLVQSSSRDFRQAGNLHYEAEDLRKQCVTFLQFIKVYLHKFLDGSLLQSGRCHPFEEQEAQLPSALLQEVFGLTLLVGRLRDLPPDLQAAFTIQSQGTILPPSWHLLHLHLDVHWCVLEILHLLGLKMQGQVVYAHQFVNLTGENLTDTSLFEEHLCSLLSDLAALAMGKYSKVRPTEALSVTHVPCACVKELWILLLHLLDHRSRLLHTQSFWSYMNTMLRPVVSGGPAVEPFGDLPSHCQDPLGFSWWLLTHVALLGRVSRSGTVHAEPQTGDNWTFTEELLKITCNPKGGLQEEQVRMHVHCCLTLSLLWGPSTAAVSTLWDYYSRNLSSSFLVPWLGVAALGSLCKSPVALVERARRCCCPAPLLSEEHAQLYRSWSSFHMFLQILALCLSQERGGGASQRQIKGRIYSKFSQKKMQELSEAGLMNFLLLFLVVARQVELEDVAGRACELLGFLPQSCAPGHRALVWRGQLALLLLFQERGLDVGAQAAWLASSFNLTTKEFYSRTTEASRRLALWAPLASYLEGVAEVFETSSSLSLSEEKLLSEGFGWLLPACRQSELTAALGFLQTVLAQLRRVHQRAAQGPTWAPPHASVGKERHLAVAAALWTHFFPFLRGLRLSQTPPAQLADAAAGFTLLAFDLPTSAPHDLQPNPVQSILQSFGWDDMLHPLLVTRYLPHLLQNSDVVASLGGDCGAGSGQSLSVRAWVRCVLQQHLHKNQDGSDSRTSRTLEQQLCELTRLVLRLPEVDGLLQEAQRMEAQRTEPQTAMEPHTALELFIKSVGVVYSRIQVLSERSAMIQRSLDYIGDILKHIKPVLVGKNPEALHRAYWALGLLVKHWSPLLATVKAQQLLFRIVDVLLLPHSILQQENVLRENLPPFLQGLSAAAGVSQSQGAPLRQQLRSVTRRYLEHFLPATPSVGGVANHPVLLSACETRPTTRGAALRRTILEVLSESFLQFRGHAPPPRLASALMFVVELLRRNRDSDPTLLVLPLPSVLRSLVLVSDAQVRAASTDALQLVVERCGAAAAALGPCEQMIAVFRSFVAESEGVFERQMYSVLESVAVLDPAVVQTLIPDLTQSLRNTEHKRGLGRNTALRAAYQKLLLLVGAEGEAELRRLDED